MSTPCSAVRRPTRRTICDRDHGRGARLSAGRGRGHQTPRGVGCRTSAWRRRRNCEPADTPELAGRKLRSGWWATTSAALHLSDVGG